MLVLLYTLIATHLTIICVTIYLHRSQTHRGIDLHPVVAHAMRFWLWLTTGMVTREWVAVHRQHHRYCEEVNDPHSPQHYGILTVLFGGAWLYNRAAADKKTVDSYASDCPTDWIERRLYTPYNKFGLLILLTINIMLFGWLGIIAWAVQMIWIPFWAAGFINGIGHFWGYRNGKTRDNSRNIVPWGIIVGGEELHNNHHLDPRSPKLSRRPWEFDIGWAYTKLLCLLKLAKLRHVPNH